MSLHNLRLIVCFHNIDCLLSEQTLVIIILCINLYLLGAIAFDCYVKGLTGHGAFMYYRYNRRWF